MNERLTIYKNFSFEASHVLPKHPSQCSRLHGHSWKLTVGISGPVNPETGFVVDYGELSELVKAHIISRVDHHHLGFGNMTGGRGDETTYTAAFGPDFYPSSENLVKAFVRILQPLVQELGEPERVSSFAMKVGTESVPLVTSPATIQLESITLDETGTCRCEWRRDA